MSVLYAQLVIFYMYLFPTHCSEFRHCIQPHFLANSLKQKSREITKAGPDSKSSLKSGSKHTEMFGKER